MSMKILDNTLSILAEALNLRSINQNVIVSNITNADTPEYKAKKVDFDTEFQNYAKALKDSPDMTQKILPEVTEDFSESAGNDGNTVNLDTELSKLAKNTIIYNAATKLMANKIKLLKYAITGGGR